MWIFFHGETLHTSNFSIPQNLNVLWYLSKHWFTLAQTKTLKFILIYTIIFISNRPRPLSPSLRCFRWSLRQALYSTSSVSLNSIFANDSFFSLLLWTKKTTMPATIATADSQTIPVKAGAVMPPADGGEAWNTTVKSCV